MDNRAIIEWDKAKRERFRKRCDKACKNSEPKFAFEGHNYLTRYAEYLLEYLDMKMGA